ncbi:IS1182 family transposase [Gelria sp. Kuro-4]|uniref:IS1182 family transposase n=1 Tax=Gelria sp. Kuro-4 TaxID=2796927 RepID=UPI001BF13CB0|nr:IS1182 family transposase [Gelria sp. Kuro-4]BCV24823.1 transposase [Gelria sp. Kuro-4]BCV25563.1 transposase [Gelria sp. Kuro-4]
MFRTRKTQQLSYEFVNIEDLVPKDHLLRKITKYIDFGFITEKTKNLYCEDNGRPCIDPVILFKMLFIGYIYGIRSERRLVEEIKVNVAYRWFLGLSLSDLVPHHSTISQNRRRRFNGTDVFQQIFDEIVFQAMSKGLIDGKELFSDSTFLKANASKSKFTIEKVAKSTKDYVEELDKAVEDDRLEHGKKPLKDKGKEPPETRQTRISTTDPESGHMVREGKPRGFFYLEHRTVDGKLNLITDSYVTAGNVHDSVPYLSRLDRQIHRFGFKVEAVALDAGYLTNPIAHGLRQKGIYAVIAHRRFRPKKGVFHKWQYKYDPEQDHYTCPAGSVLTYRTTNREGYREYKSDPEVCKKCPMLSRCTHSKNHTKVLTRHVWEDDKEWIRENRLSVRGKELYRRRKLTIERSFADSKELHGLRYCRMRGRSKVTEQCLLTAACQNMKKMALFLWKQGQGPSPSSRLHQLLQHLFSFISPILRLNPCTA